MQLLTKEVRKALPPLYTNEEKGGQAVVRAKFFTSDSSWTWYATEFDGEDRFFGLVVGLETEVGYFSLAELKSVRGPFGLKIERDRYFTPKPLAELDDCPQWLKELAPA